MPTAKTDCIHHWKIDIPNGPFSNGICLKCGAEQTFRNYVEHKGDFQKDWTTIIRNNGGIAVLSKRQFMDSL